MKLRKCIEVWINRAFMAGRHYQKYADKNRRTLAEVEECERLVEVTDEAVDVLVDLLRREIDHDD